MNCFTRMIVVGAIGLAAISAARAQGYHSGYAHTGAVGGIGPGFPSVASGAMAGPGRSRAHAAASGPGFNRGLAHTINRPGHSQAHGLAIHQGPNSFGNSQSSAIHNPYVQQSLSTTVHGGRYGVGGSVSGSITVGNVSRSFSRSFGRGAGSRAGSGNYRGGSVAGSQVGYPYMR
jgi:hypothetical protein